ncbi:hypothetical protein BDV97DRAFT_151022 [Delphinella strobiligena]|nr:hypothetical protein BDV97DRAFT_151022 [Delphinella strobiligena]
MASRHPVPPVISIKLDLSPETFHFSDARPPALSLTLRSKAPEPISIELGYGSPLDPTSAMQHGAYPRLPSQQKRYVTLLPDISATILVAFTRGGSFEPKFRPQPWKIVRRGRLLDRDGNETQARRSPVVCGCDGLEAGKKYKVTVATEKLLGRSWWWGTEEDIRQGTATVPTFFEDDEKLCLALQFEVENGGVEFSVEA